MWTRRKIKVFLFILTVSVYFSMTYFVMETESVAFMLRSSSTTVVFSMEEILANPATLSPEEKISRIEKFSRNIPVGFLERHREEKLRMNDTCSYLPSLPNIKYNNIFWQTLTSSNGTFYLYSAYYDNRTLEPERPVIRFTAIVNRVGNFAKTNCQIWFEEQDTPIFSEASYALVWYKEWGHYNNQDLNPYIITCKIPSSHRDLVPQAVSLVENPCDYSTNVLKVIYDPPPSGKKEGFAVCVKGSEFYIGDQSERIIEWLELHFSMGAHKVFYYDFGMNPKMATVMGYYVKKGLVEVIPLTMPEAQPNIPGLVYPYLDAKYKYQHEVIPYNDCFYRNIYRYRYTVHADPDEIIIPRNANSWHELMEIVVEKSKTENAFFSSYSAPHTFYMDEMLPPEGYFRNIPKYLHIMQHVYRSANYTPPGHNIKCFHDTERGLGLHNHFPIHCLGGLYNCQTYFIKTEDAQMQHYRKTCQSFVSNCYETYKKHTVLDPTAWRFKDDVIARVKKTLVDLNYLQDLHI